MLRRSGSPSSRASGTRTYVRCPAPSSPPSRPRLCAAAGGRSGRRIDSVQGNYTVSLIEGDGIGPEISNAVKNIFAAAKVCPLTPLPWSRHHVTSTTARHDRRLTLA